MMNEIYNRLEILCPDCRSLVNKENGKFICSGCGLTYDMYGEIPVMVKEIRGEGMDYISHYQIDAEEFDYFAERDCQATANDEKRLREYILSFIHERNAVILDVGCGGAWAAKSLIPDGHELVSFDISPINTARALETVPSDKHYAIAGDALNPPFKECSFDIIIAAEIIEHTSDPAAFADSLFGMLKPGGRLIISTPHNEKIVYSLCVHCNKPTPRNAHLHSFDEKKMAGLIKDDFLAGVEIKSFGNKAHLLLRAYKITSWMPFTLWRIYDAILNKLINKKEHLIAVYTRKAEK